MLSEKFDICYVAGILKEKLYKHANAQVTANLAQYTI